MLPVSDSRRRWPTPRNHTVQSLATINGSDSARVLVDFSGSSGRRLREILDRSQYSQSHVAFAKHPVLVLSADRLHDMAIDFGKFERHGC